MNKLIPKLRLFCCIFSGEDGFIIRKCNNSIQRYFALIGLFVLCVFALCWISAALFMSHIFDGARWLSVPVGIVWAMLITNLYFLLLYTISPALLPVAGKRQRLEVKAADGANAAPARPRYLLFSFSFLARTGFIAFLAVVIAQPFNIWLYAPRYEAADLLAATIRQVLDTKPQARLVTVLFCGIMLFPVFCKYRIRKISRDNFRKDFDRADADPSIRRLREQLGNPTGSGELFGQILAADLGAIRTSDFYFQKTLLEYRIVLEEYELFKDEYTRILNDKVQVAGLRCERALEPYLNRLKRIDPGKHRLLQLQIERYLWSEPVVKYEPWADPPFCTVPATAAAAAGPETELLHVLYPDNN